MFIITERTDSPPPIADYYLPSEVRWEISFYKEGIVKFFLEGENMLFRIAEEQDLVVNPDLKPLSPLRDYMTKDTD